MIVTGAAGGIGRKLAEAFATTGARVMAVDLMQDGVEAVVAGLEAVTHVAVERIAVEATLFDAEGTALGALFFQPSFGLIPAGGRTLSAAWPRAFSAYSITEACPGMTNSN